MLTVLDLLVSAYGTWVTEASYMRGHIVESRRRNKWLFGMWKWNGSKQRMTLLEFTHE